MYVVYANWCGSEIACETFASKSAAESYLDVLERAGYRGLRVGIVDDNLQFAERSHKPQQVKNRYLQLVQA